MSSAKQFSTNNPRSGPAMKHKQKNNLAILTCLSAAAVIFAEPGFAQQIYESYQFQEVRQGQQATPLLFGVAAFKLCQIKTFLFAGVYILGAIAFVIFAIRALFTKFEMKQFVPILGALFVVASSDLFISWISDQAFYCPTTFTQLGN
jgi:hypothetical protein